MYLGRQGWFGNMGLGRSRLTSVGLVCFWVDTVGLGSSSMGSVWAG